MEEKDKRILYWVGGIVGVLLVLYVLTRKPVSTSAAPQAVPASTGTDAASLLGQLESAITAQNQALANLETQNSEATAAAFLQGFGSVATGLRSLSDQITQGFETLKPPTVTLPDLIAAPTSAQLDAIAAHGGAVDTSGHKDKLYFNQAQEYYLCQLAKLAPTVFAGLDTATCKALYDASATGAAS